MVAKKKKKKNTATAKKVQNKPHNSGFKTFTRIGAIVLVVALIAGMIAMYGFRF